MRQKFSIVILLALCCALSSCDVQKRLYRKGFYINWPVGNTTAPATASEVPVSVENTAEEANVIADTEVIADSAQTAAANDSAIAVAEKDKAVLFPERVLEKPAIKHHTAPIEKDKGQAIGAGIASAIFFVLGMVGLILKGTAGPVGIFIGAAFLCFLLCMFLAAFLYPREPVVKQPKDKIATDVNPAAKVGIVVLVCLFILLILAAIFFLSIFTGLFF